MKSAVWGDVLEESLLMPPIIPTNLIVTDRGSLQLGLAIHQVPQTESNQLNVSIAIGSKHFAFPHH
jgi:hypothetical protein